jgi:hypothetical protein
MSFDPFLDLYGRKTLKNRSNDPLGSIFGTFCLFFVVFIFKKNSFSEISSGLFLLLKALVER